MTCHVCEEPLKKLTAQGGPGCTATKCPAPSPAQPWGLLSPTSAACILPSPTHPPTLFYHHLSRGTVPTPVLLSFLGPLVENFTAATKPGCQQASRDMGGGAALTLSSSLPSLQPPTQTEEEVTMAVLYLLSHKSDPEISQGLYFKSHF